MEAMIKENTNLRSEIQIHTKIRETVVMEKLKANIRSLGIKVKSNKKDTDVFKHQNLGDQLYPIVWSKLVESKNLRKKSQDHNEAIKFDQYHIDVNMASDFENAFECKSQNQIKQPLIKEKSLIQDKESLKKLFDIDNEGSSPSDSVSLGSENNFKLNKDKEIKRKDKQKGQEKAE